MYDTLQYFAWLVLKKHLAKQKSGIARELMRRPSPASVPGFEMRDPVALPAYASVHAAPC